MPKRAQPKVNNNYDDDQPEVITLCGCGISGLVDGKNAKLHNPWGIATNSAGDIIFCDNGNHSLRKLDIQTGEVITLLPQNRVFTTPIGVVIDRDDNIYVSDFSHRIHKIAPDFTISVLAGSHGSGFIDGYGTNARFAHPWAMCLENEENILVADFNNHAVRRIRIKNGYVETVAYGTNNIPTPTSGIKASFLNPCGVAVEEDGNILVADKGNHAIKRVDLKKKLYIQ